MIKDEDGVWHYHYEKAMKQIEFLLEIEKYKEIYFDVLNEMSRLDDLIDSYHKSVKSYVIKYVIKYVKKYVKIMLILKN